MLELISKREVITLNNMALLHPRVRETLASFSDPLEVLSCEAELADTEVFCRHYGFSLRDSANTIVVKGKRGEETRYAACVLLATTRLDVNRVVRKRLGVRRMSFASAEETRDLTGMEIGGVTAPGLPPELPLWVDDKVMAREFVLLGGGNRQCKLKAPPSLLLALPGVEVVAEMAEYRDQQP